MSVGKMLILGPGETRMILATGETRMILATGKTRMIQATGKTRMIQATEETRMIQATGETKMIQATGEIKIEEMLVGMIVEMNAAVHHRGRDQDHVNDTTIANVLVLMKNEDHDQRKSVGHQ